MSIRDHSYYMTKAYQEALKAKKIGEIPVGAVIVNKDGDIVSTGYNQTISSNDSSAHAEIVALRALGQRVSNYRFPDYSIYVTLEPCCMCAMALIHARLKNLYFGAYDLKTGACGSAFNLISDPKHNHKIIFEGGILKKECSALLSDFFKERRQPKKELKKIIHDFKSKLGS